MQAVSLSMRRLRLWWRHLAKVIEKEFFLCTGYNSVGVNGVHIQRWILPIDWIYLNYRI